MFVIILYYLESDCLCEKSTKTETDDHKESFERNTAGKIYREVYFTFV